MVYAEKVLGVGRREILKSSAVRGIRANITDLYPSAEPVLDDILPKKATVMQVKCANFLVLYAVQGDGKPLFFQHDNGQLLPHLSVLHMYPSMMPRVQVDKGAIKFVLRGADVMAPGLISAGGALPDGLKEGDAVAIFAEGKEHPMAIGIMKMSSEDIRKQGNGIAIENAHHMLDSLWMAKENVL